MSEVKSFTELYQHCVYPNELLSTFLCGHLSVEFMLHKLACISDIKNQSKYNRYTYYQLVNVNFDMGNITQEQKDVLLAINQLRNKFAHKLNYLPKIQEFLGLYELAAGAFCDLTDGIDQGLDALRNLTNIDEFEQWDMSELFVQICYDLHEQYQDIGGDIEEF
ncbi:hypothetical protein L5M51_14175 [Shewanella sp. SM73]|uniref:hypothetical protein n=1 Tax=Shewanella TaxID=22 RepID=UPI0021D9A045|nr:hypothetical protein [Shewanella sp. SM73]MCU8030896.1 hypothetical protein [Shewanella sp. SM73]